MSNEKINFITSAMTQILEQEGFSRNMAGFFRVRPQFVDYLSIQVKNDHSAITFNAGVQPLFLLPPEKQTINALSDASEIDCYIRTRLTPEEKNDYWFPLDTETLQLVAEVKVILKNHGLLFFEFFTSVESLCSAITIEGIQSNNLVMYFSMLTKSRLALLGAKANLLDGNIFSAKELAEYGLSVVGMAVSLKREFKEIIAKCRK